MHISMMSVIKIGLQYQDKKKLHFKTNFLKKKVQAKVIKASQIYTLGKYLEWVSCITFTVRPNAIQKKTLLRSTIFQSPYTTRLSKWNLSQLFIRLTTYLASKSGTVCLKKRSVYVIYSYSYRKLTINGHK